MPAISSLIFSVISSGGALRTKTESALGYVYTNSSARKPGATFAHRRTRTGAACAR